MGKGKSRRKREYQQAKARKQKVKKVSMLIGAGIGLAVLVLFLVMGFTNDDGILIDNTTSDWEQPYGGSPDDVALEEPIDTTTQLEDVPSRSRNRQVVEEPGIIDRIKQWFGAPFAEVDWFKEEVGNMHSNQPATRIANDTNGDLHVCWHETIAGVTTLKYGKYNGSWSTETVDAGGGVNNVGRYCDIATNSTNDVHISYYDATVGDLRYATGRYTQWQNITIDTANNVGLHTAIAINSTDDIHILHHDSTNTDTRYVTGLYGQVWFTETMDFAGDNGFYTDIAINSTDIVHAIYQRYDNWDLVHSAGTFTNWQRELIVTGSANMQSGFTNSMVINATDDLNIAYSEDLPAAGVQTLSVKYAYGTWGNWNNETVVPGVAGGVRYAYSGLGLGTNNEVYISYHDYWTNYDLFFANGSTGDWTLDTIDTAGDVGKYDSLVMVDDVAHISYYDGSNSKIKHATRSFAAGAGGGGAGSGTYINVTFDNPSISASTVTFDIALNYSTVDNPAANVTFVYNEINRTSVVLWNQGNVSLWRTTMQVPTVSGSTTYPIYWNATGIDTFNRTGYMYHTVTALSVDNCSTNTNLILNVSHFNESLANTSVNLSMNTNFQFRNIEGVASNLNFTFQMYPQIYHEFCMPANISDWFEADVEAYLWDTAEVYAPRYHYWVNTNFSVDETINTSTYALINAEATTFNLELFDATYRKLPSHYIMTQRYYPGELVYRVVEISKTDDHSETLNRMSLEDHYYRFIVVDPDGNVLITKDPFRPYCAVGEICSRAIYVPDTGLQYNLWDKYDEYITYNLSYDTIASNSYFTYDYVDASGETDWGRLEVIGRAGANTSLICNTTLNAAAGSIVCNMTPYVNTSGDYYANAYISRSPERWYAQIIETFNTAYLTYGVEGVFYALLIFGVIALSAIWNPTASIVMAVFGLGALKILGLVYIPMPVLIAAAVVGAVIIWRTSKG